VVTSTRTGSGRIAPPRAPAPGAAPPNPQQQPNAAQQRRRQFTVAAEDHAPLKARILLMLALAKTNDRAEIQRIFSEY
jgi:L-asparaginase/Glu-tRNA(Gln) amidotransferase subunit D